MLRGGSSKCGLSSDAKANVTVLRLLDNIVLDFQNPAAISSKLRATLKYRAVIMFGIVIPGRSMLPGYGYSRYRWPRSDSHPARCGLTRKCLMR